MNVLELLMVLEDEGFTQILLCDNEIIVFGNDAPIPPDLAHQLRINSPELKPLLRRITNAQLRQLTDGEKPIQKL